MNAKNSDDREPFRNPRDLSSSFLQRYELEVKAGKSGRVPESYTTMLEAINTLVEHIRRIDGRVRYIEHYLEGLHGSGEEGDEE